MKHGRVEVGVMQVIVLTVALAGCQRVTHDMADQPRTLPQAPSAFFPDGEATRPPVAGTVPYAVGDQAAISSGRAGRDVALTSGAASTAASTSTSRPASATSPPVVATALDDAARLARGHDRYAIFCTPCHGVRGDSDGEVVRRGFPAPPRFRDAIALLRDEASVRGIVRHGLGAMPAFADRIDAQDEAAIARYVRSLAAGPTPGVGAAR